MAKLTTIGWREWVSFPDLVETKIKAKVDTGARTSCLDVMGYEVFEKGEKSWVRFTLQKERGNPGEKETFERPLFSQRVVRDSGGHEVLRPFIKTKMAIGNIEYEIELSLTQRPKMKFGVLIGRIALKDRFIVDVGENYLIGKKSTRTTK